MNAQNPPRQVNLSPSMTGDEALRRIGKTCIEIVNYHHPIALNGKPDGVHQMRVSVRRLRAALTGFEKHIQIDTFEWANGELRWLADVLGEARDLDVFENSLLEQVKDKLPETQALIHPVKQSRLYAYDTVQQTLVSPRYLALKHGLQLWFEDDEMEIGDGKRLEQPLKDTVPIILTKTYKAARRLTKGFGHQSEKKRHRLRIALKKLRYTSELFGSIYTDGREGRLVKDFTVQLKQLQDDLGDANDVHVARQIIDRIDDEPDIARAGERLLSFHERRIADNEEDMQKHMSKFLSTPLFWQ